MRRESVARDPLREVRTQSGAGDFTRRVEEGDAAHQIAKPELGGALFEEEPLTLPELRLGV